MWNEIVSNVKRYAGTSGTVTLPPGAHVLQIIAHGSGGGSTIQIFNDASAIPIDNVNSYFVYRPQHLVTTAQASNNTIVFTNTVLYMIEVALPAGA